MTDIEQAISLINQGRKMEAQSILTHFIRSNPQEIQAWFLYAKTLESTEKRVQLLEACLRQNSDNAQVAEALELLRSQQPANPPAAPAPFAPTNASAFPADKEPAQSTSHGYPSASEQPRNKFEYIETIEAQYNTS